MMVVRTSSGEVVAQQTKEGTLWLLKSIERELYWGNAWFSNGGELDGHIAAIPASSIGMNGLQQQLLRGGVDLQQQSGDFQGYGIDKSNSKDIRGAGLQHDDVEDGALAIFENFGMGNEMHLEPAALSAFSKIFYPKERITNMGVPEGRAGFVLREFVSSAGTISMKPNVFLRPAQRITPFVPERDAPAVPTTGAVVSAAVPAGVVVSDFAATDVVKYRVLGVNDRGKSSPSLEVTGTVVTDGDQLSLVINATVGAKSYAVYRTRVGGASNTEEFIGNVAPVVVGGAVTFVDRNRKLPGIGEAYIMTMASENLTFKQLTPLSKINLAITQAALEWLMILYGCLIVYSPRKNFIIRNVGR
jgi:hypothetical protein